MLRAFLVFLYLGVVQSFLSSGMLDLSELHSVQYSVEILDTPVVDTEEDTQDQVTNIDFFLKFWFQ